MPNIDNEEMKYLNRKIKYKNKEYILKLLSVDNYGIGHISIEDDRGGSFFYAGEIEKHWGNNKIEIVNNFVKNIYYKNITDEDFENWNGVIYDHTNLNSLSHNELCKYCDPNLDSNIIVDEDSECFVYVDGGDLFVEYHNYSNSFCDKARINFCPMCGRRM